MDGLQADGGTVDALDKWFLEQTSSPVGSLLLFVLVFLARVSLDRWGRRDRPTKKKPRKGTSHG